MSTINSYFNTRKSRGNKVDSSKNVTNKDNTILSHFAAQAPQPIYTDLKKQPLTTTTIKQKTKQDNKNSILYYLSPVNRSATKNVSSKESEVVETTIPCQIRSVIPVASIWDHILEEFDPESHTNQLTHESTPSPSPSTNNDHEFEIMEVIPTNKASRRRRLDEECDSMIRNVRIRTKPTVFCLEEYLLEDIQEDLSRPLRTQYSSKQTNTLIMDIFDEVFYYL